MLDLTAKELLKIYINQLNWNIIPVKEDKRPAYYEWKKYQDTKISIEDFNNMMRYVSSRQIVTRGLALITGKRSGITVVDFDEGSEDVLKTIETPVVQTGGGGRHYYFKYTDKLSQGANSSLHIDIRNDGGYAILPPSKTNKGEYKWIKDFNTPLAEVPADFIASYKKDIVEHRWDFGGVSTGGRNTRSASVIGAFIKACRKDLDLAWDATRAWNDRNSPPIGEEQLRATFQWCVNKDLSNNPPPKPSKSFATMTEEELLRVVTRPTLKTGLKEIDVGFPHPSGFYIICANPGVGKGWYALWLTKQFYSNNRARSVYFSLEMTTNLIKKRILQAWSNLTQEKFKTATKEMMASAVAMLKEDVIRVDEFGGSDTSGVTVSNFKEKVAQYYDEGFRVFHFDHLHELTGANVNDTNQSVVESWAKCFQGICKDYPDIWLFVFAQPNAKAAEKVLLRRTDIAGSKSITQKCEFFFSLNRKVEVDDSFGTVRVVNDDRNVFLYLDKNRITDAQYVAFNLYFDRTGNFLSETSESEESVDSVLDNFMGVDL